MKTHSTYIVAHCSSLEAWIWDGHYVSLREGEGLGHIVHSETNTFS